MKLLANLLSLLLLSLTAVPSHAAITQQDFDEVLDLAERLYQNDFIENNQRLQVVRYWSSDTPSASAWKHEDINGEISVIQINGGIARHPEINKDSFALIVCHEIGHHLAGGPMVWRFSVEGQADYYGASACLRRLLPLMPATSKPEHPLAYGMLEHICSRGMQNTDDQKLCIRIASAGLSLTRFFAVENELPMPAFDISDETVSIGVTSGAASPQCRLDTYLAAALCDHSANTDAPSDKKWLCEGDTVAARPVCWYGLDR